MRHILNRFNGHETLIMTSKSIIVLLGNNQQVNDLTIKAPPEPLCHMRPVERTTMKITPGS